MVAIHLPQPEPRGWSAPLAAPPVAPRRTPADPSTTRRRPATPSEPDRATRYRRRRLAALVLTALAAVALAGSVQYLSSLSGSGHPTAPADASPTDPFGAPLDVVEGQVYIVQPGDTLWTVAAALSPGSDLRPVVDRLRAANGDATLEPGQRLVLDID